MRTASLGLNATVILSCISLVSCAAQCPVTIVMQNKILRGSASDGRVGRDVIFYVKHVDGLSCDGIMLPS